MAGGGQGLRDRELRARVGSKPCIHRSSAELSRLLFDTEQFERAEVSYRREMELTPEHFGPRHQLGVMFIRTGRYVEAIELLKQAILLNPNSGASYSSLGAAYTDFDQARGK